MTMGRCHSMFGQFGETATARCCNAHNGDVVCCAFAPQLVCIMMLVDVQRTGETFDSSKTGSRGGVGGNWWVEGPV